MTLPLRLRALVYSCQSLSFCEVVYLLRSVRVALMASRHSGVKLGLAHDEGRAQGVDSCTPRWMTSIRYLTASSTCCGCTVSPRRCSHGLSCRLVLTKVRNLSSSIPFQFRRFGASAGSAVAKLMIVRIGRWSESACTPSSTFQLIILPPNLSDAKTRSSVDLLPACIRVMESGFNQRSSALTSAASRQSSAASSCWTPSPSSACPPSHSRGDRAVDGSAWPGDVRFPDMG